jgi:hypothetical protein
MVDAIVRCGKGIQSVVKTVNNSKCAVRIPIYKANMIATSNTTGTFVDQSSTNVINKECVTLTPELQSLTFAIDSRIDDCVDDCSNLREYITTKGAEAIYNGNEAELMTTITTASGTAIPLGAGDLLGNLIKLWKTVKNVQTNKNKEIVMICNQAIIDELNWLRDDENRLMFNVAETCPITGCETVCRAKMKLVAVDDYTIPVSNTGQTDVYCFCADNIMFTNSVVEIKERRWDETLNDLDDIVVYMNYRKSLIPAMFPNSVKKMTFTI